MQGLETKEADGKPRSCIGFAPNAEELSPTTKALKAKVMEQT